MIITTDIVLLLFIIMLGSYIQTITGFGLAIIVIGVSGALSLGSIATLAIVVSFITLTNCLFALRGLMKFVKWDVILFTSVGIIPGIIIGIISLEHLSQNASNALKALLGVNVLVSGILFILKPKSQDAVSSHVSFAFAGFLAGLAGGAFGMAGPPVAYQIYKQPYNIVMVKALLLTLFCCTSGVRTLVVLWEGHIPQDVWNLSIIAIPLVMLTTIAARRFPPPVSAQTLKKSVIVLLIVVGFKLIVEGLSLLFRIS
ncbi:hypothetical protein CS022_23900 [Veronia nyctiphanis]|uniref:Probable membrane transporter protein n=1 Tax=Veronia nyctiphanis TaxID=1278244 RepID=A0A4V1LRR3_9GAMM|nr:sulfite exporter TauE/SafE family protein [Veronia nyctiphanis]RXJ69098.1 hypothetical protein CS022_23900 [Veronia nyctiphanis]